MKREPVTFVLCLEPLSLSPKLVTLAEFKLPIMPEAPVSRVFVLGQNYFHFSPRRELQRWVPQYQFSLTAVIDLSCEFMQYNE